MFCFQKANKEKFPNKFLNDEKKVESIEQVRLFINNELPNDSHVLLVGGELFDFDYTYEIKMAFDELINDIARLMRDNFIELLYLNTNLIYNTDLHNGIPKWGKSNLDRTLETLNNYLLLDRVKFTTSWDIFGRFTNSWYEQKWDFNMAHLKRYLGLKTVTNVMLTRPMCEAIVSDWFDMRKFIKTYGQVNTIPYIILREELAPSRQLLFKTLLHLDSQMPGYLKAYVDNFALPQEKHLYEFDGEKLNYVSSPNSECGHNVNFKLVDMEKKHCFICDTAKRFIAFGRLDQTDNPWP